MKHYPVTAAVRALRAGKIDFIPHLYPYEEYGGTHQAASALNVTEYEVIKTLVMEIDSRGPLLVLMLDRMFINGGKRGFMVEIKPRVLQNVLPFQEVNVAI